MQLTRKKFAAGAAVIPASLAPRARAAEFEFKCGWNLAVDHPISVRTAQMWNAVEKESGGRIHVQLFPNSELGSDLAMLSQLRLGALGWYLVTPAILASVVPVANIGYLGFAYKDDNEGLRAMDGPLGAYIRRETVTKGLYSLAVNWDGGMTDIGSNSRPIRTPEDLRGFKIRVSPSKITTDLFQELGASPIPMNFSDVYTALQTKLLDGEAAPLIVIETSHLFEVNRYVSLTGQLFASYAMTTTNDIWQKLPPDLQKIIDRNNAKYALLQRRDMAVMHDSVIDKLRRRGLAINRPDQSPFRAGVQSYYKQWAAAFGPTAWNLLESSLGRKLI